VAYRSQPRPSLLDGVLVADWLEIIAEHHLDAPAEDRERLEELRRDYPLVPHGLEMSIGSPDGLNGRYLEAVAGLVSDLAAPWFSDHLCFTRSGGVPLLLENITYHLDMGGELTEAQFLCEILEHGDCGLLLDVTNLHVNSVNHRYDPIEFLNTIPLERVGQVHLAAASGATGSFGTPIRPRCTRRCGPCWSTCSAVRSPPESCERDDAFESAADDLAADLGRARALMSTAGRGRQ